MTRQAAGYGVSKETQSPKPITDFGQLVWEQAVTWVGSRSAGVVTTAQMTTGKNQWAISPVAPPAYSLNHKTAQDQREAYATEVWLKAVTWMDVNTNAHDRIIMNARKANPYDSTPGV